MRDPSWLVPRTNYCSLRASARSEGLRVQGVNGLRLFHLVKQILQPRPKVNLAGGGLPSRFFIALAWCGVNLVLRDQINEVEWLILHCIWNGLIAKASGISAYLQSLSILGPSDICTDSRTDISIPQRKQCAGVSRVLVRKSKTIKASWE